MKEWITLVVLALAFSSGVSMACDCKPVPPVRQAYAEGQEILWGRVLAREQVHATAPESLGARSLYRYTIALTQRFKGTVADTVFIYSGLGVEDCGYPFQVGNAYLIYASTSSFRDGDHPAGRGVLYTSVCGRTKPYSGHEARLLGRLAQEGVKGGGRGY